MHAIRTSLFALTLASAAAAQVTYGPQTFPTNLAGWSGTNWSQYTGTSACGGSGGAVRFNLYSGATTANLVSPSLGTSTGGVTTITYDFKAANWNANTVGAPNMGSYDVQYGATASGPWTTFATVSGVAQTGLCLPQSHVFTPPAGALFVRFSASWISGDYYLNFDNIGLTEVPVACSGTPAPGNVTGVPVTVCAGSSFTLGLQNPTGGTGVSYQWYASTVSNTGPWTAAGTSATLTTSQLVQSWYYCDVTCSAGPSTGSSTVAQVDMAPASTFPQTWGGGIINPDCWSVSALVGPGLPDYNAASGYSVGTGSARFNFYSIQDLDQPTLTSPIFAPVGPGTNVVFDVAGVTYTGGEIDTIVLEESNDSGATWTTVVTMDNNPAGGVLNTFGAPGTTSSNFVPTAAQWATLSYSVTAGSNRIRFRGISGFGNNVFLDNVKYGTGLPASHSVYGSGCATPAFTLTAAPAPISTAGSGTTVVYSLNNIPLACPSPDPVFNFGVLLFSFGQDVAGTDLLSGYGIDSPGCNLHITTLDLVVGYIGSVPNQTVNADVPAGVTPGTFYYAQAAALICPVAPNNAGILLSNGVASYISNY